MTDGEVCFLYSQNPIGKLIASEEAEEVRTKASLEGGLRRREGPEGGGQSDGCVGVITSRRDQQEEEVTRVNEGAASKENRPFLDNRQSNTTCFKEVTEEMEREER